MPEHTPAPTPARAVYGFGVFLLFKTLFILYVIWVYVPKQFLEETLGLTYLPDKYFALFIPILIMVALWLFAFCIYPMMGFAKTANIDSIETIRDSRTIRLCEYKDAEGRMCKGVVDNQPKDGFYFRRYCNKHVGDKNVEVSIKDDHIRNFCDCQDKQYCLLKQDPEYLDQLRLRKTVPSAYDLDIADVCKKLYGN